MRATLAVIVVLAMLLVTSLVASAYWPQDGYFEHQAQFPVLSRQSARDIDGGTALALRLENEAGVSVTARVLLPEQKERLRPIVILGGHETGSRAVELVGPRPGAAIMALDYPYQGSVKVRSVWDALGIVDDVRRASLDTPVAVSMALTWLEKQPWTRKNSVELVGVSLGVPYAATAAALDPRVAKLWLIHGAADNLRWLEVQTARRIDSRPQSLGLARFIYWVLCTPNFHTPSRAAAFSPRPVVVVGAREDERTPEEEVVALYEAALEPKRLIWTTGGHIDPDKTDLVAELLELVESSPPGGG